MKAKSYKADIASLVASAVTPFSDSKYKKVYAVG